jgi:hypothetical protein
MVYRLELILNDFFTRRVQWQLSRAMRTALAGAMWLVALALLVPMSRVGWLFWWAGNARNQAVAALRNYGYTSLSLHGAGPFLYIGLAVLGVTVVAILISVPGLQKMQKLRGWNALFYGLLVFPLFALCTIVAGIGKPAFLVEALAITVVMLYLVFQVRSFFVPPRPGDHKVGVEKTKA